MSVFVAFFVLLLLLADSTPPAAASIPLIGKQSLLLASSFLGVSNYRASPLGGSVIWWTPSVSMSIRLSRRLHLLRTATRK